MGRILSGGVNSSVTGGGTLQNLSTVMVTGEAVVQGQLACVGSDGLAYYALDPAGPGGALRPISGVAGASQPFPAGPAQALPGATSIYNAGCTLSNGNVVMVGASGSTLQLGVFNPLGVQLGASVTLTHVAPSINLYAVSLTGGNFALAYQDQGTLAATVAIFSSTGAQILAPLIVEAGVAAASLSIAPLTGGGFAVAYCTGSGTVRYAVYSNTGAVVQAPAATGLTSIVTASPCAVSVCGLSGGGFAVAGIVSNTFSAYFSRFNAAGVAQQTAVTASSNGSGAIAAASVCAVGVGSGGFVIVHSYGSSTNTMVTTLNASGVTVGATYYVAANASNFYPGCVAVARGDAVVVNSQGVLFIANSNGTMGPQVTVTNGLGNGSAVACWENGSILAGTYGGSFDIRDANLGLIATLQSTSLGLGSIATNGSPICILPLARSSVKPTTPLMMIMAPVAGGARYVTVAWTGSVVQKTTLIGVFGASAAAGSSVPVQYQGVATLASGFVQPFSIDTNSAAPPGQRMAIVGNQAILSGIQPPQNRRQIN